LNTKMMEAREAAAHRIFLSGSCKIDTKVGFKIAYHDVEARAPLSPFYLNLRPKGTKGGTLEQADIDAIALSMFMLGHEKELFTAHRAICSIPAAGDPYLDSIMKLASAQNIMMQRFELEKFEQYGKRAFRLHRDTIAIWRQSLLVDDLVTSALTKRLAAGAVTQMRGGVSDLLVFLNRSKTVQEELNEMGIKLHAVWEFEDLMEWALGHTYLTRSQFETIIEYPDKLDAYKKSIGATA
jgi:orotate phosphoribosyltransferase